ncbi:hypothetical protein [Actinomadura soli]|uniref:hypothetical protein n=1 Tax=Actinomadura soli TaxID=2508997 RepID=UPI0014861D35|nr:hypothetical protein [Actinomadura soli]
MGAVRPDTGSVDRTRSPTRTALDRSGDAAGRHHPRAAGEAVRRARVAQQADDLVDQRAGLPEERLGAADGVAERADAGRDAPDRLADLRELARRRQELERAEGVQPALHL